MEKKSKIQRIKSLLQNSSQEDTLGMTGKEMSGLTSRLVEDQMESIKDDIKAKLEETAAFQALKKIDVELAKMREELDPKMIIGVISTFEEEMTEENEKLSQYVDDKLSSLESELKKVRSEHSEITNNTSESLLQKMEEVKTNFLNDLESRDSSMKNEVGMSETKLNESIKSLERSISSIKNNLSKEIGDSKKDGDDFKNKINESMERLRADLISRISSVQGNNKGGSAHRKLLINDVEIATRYADINFATSGITMVASNDNVNKVTDIAVTASSGAAAPTSGAVNGVNQTFVFTNAPSILFVDGVAKQKVSSDSTVNWTGTTTVVLSIAPNFDIFGI